LMDPDPTKDQIFKIHLQSAYSHMKLAQQNHQADKFEIALKHYVDASSKFLELLKQEIGDEKKAAIRKTANDCITEVGMLKAIISD